MKNPTLVLALLLSACGTEESDAPAAKSPAPAVAEVKLVQATCGGIANLHAFGDVWLAGQPAAADFEAAKAQGVRTVVNLRARSEQGDFDEQGFVGGLGLAYLHIPIAGPSDLTDEAFASAREALAKAQRPLLLHCASANRVGAMWIPWRVLDGGLALEDAVAEAKTIGLKSPELEAKARDYVARQAGAK
jgi:uncharacterized protein (TIGR01244 family)